MMIEKTQAIANKKIAAEALDRNEAYDLYRIFQEDMNTVQENQENIDDKFFMWHRQLLLKISRAYRVFIKPLVPEGINAATKKSEMVSALRDYFTAGNVPPVENEEIVDDVMILEV